MQEIESETKKIGTVWYKRSKIKNAFHWKHGEWVASGRLNSEVFKRRIRAPSVQENLTGLFRKTWGMSDAMTYCEAVDMRASIDAGVTTAAREARLHGKDCKVFQRAMNILDTKGPEGFHRYGTPTNNIGDI